MRIGIGTHRIPASGEREVSGSRRVLARRDRRVGLTPTPVAPQSPPVGGSSSATSPPPTATRRASDTTGADAPPVAGPSTTPAVDPNLDPPADDVTAVQTLVAQHAEPPDGMTDAEWAQLVRLAGPGTSARLAWTEVTAQVHALIDLIKVTGGVPAPAQLALEPAVRPELRVDGVPVTGMDDAKLAELEDVPDVPPIIVDDLLQYAIADGTLDLSMSGLRNKLRDVYRLYERLVADPGADVGTGVDARIARRWVEDSGTRMPELMDVLGPSTSGLPSIRAGALHQFLWQRPRLRGNLGELTFKFNAKESDTTGDGLHQEGTVYLSRLSGMPADAFTRMFVHELGHALFQQELLRGVAPEQPHNRRLPEVWDKGEVIHLLARRRALMQAQARQNSPDRAAELTTIDTRLDGFEAVWDSMGEDARTFYRAWLVLARDNGRWLLGLDLGVDGKRPVDRQAYQAKTFTEFCAETFMQEASGALDTYLQALLNSNGVPIDVHDAWTRARDILARVARPLFAG
jgi:hypothetical protein